jgi:nucleoid-associated protein YgaU
MCVFFVILGVLKYLARFYRGVLVVITMHKDFKIGLGIGLLLVTAAVVWLCTSPKLSTESRALQNASSRPAVQSPELVEGSPVERPAITPAPVTAIPQPPEPNAPVNEQSVRFHIVQKGDTLSGISQQYYGSSRQWLKILNANRDTLPDPNRLTPGLKLIIPE